jgi:hypothetical protein
MAFKNIKKTQGRDFNYWSSTSVSWTQFGASDGYTTEDGYGPDLVITFPTYGLIFTNETSGQVVEYSFNGSTVHGVLDGTATSTTRVVTFLNRQQSLIWFRLKSGSAGPATITVTAWGTR